MMGSEKFAIPSLIDRFNNLYGNQIDHPLTYDEFVAHFHGQARETLCANLGQHFGITVDYPTLYENREWYMMQHLQNAPDGVPMADGLIEALTTLQTRGYKFAFISNNPIQRALAAMRYATNGRGEELAKLFSCHYFEAGDKQKPLPDAYLRAMQQLGTNPKHAYAIEDSVTGAKAAVAAGLTTFGYTGFADHPNDIKQKLTATGCKECFHHWDDLPGLLP